MKLSTWNKCIIGSSLNNDLIDHTSFSLIKSYASLPPAEVTICEQKAEYVIPYHQIVGGVPNVKYVCEVDYDAVGCDSLAISRTHIGNHIFSSDQRKYKPSIINMYREVIDYTPFRFVTDAKHGEVSVITMNRIVKFRYDNIDVKMTFKEIWSSPSKDISNDIYFTTPPYYQIEITTPPETTLDYFIRLLTTIIPRCYMQNDNSS